MWPDILACGGERGSENETHTLAMARDAILRYREHCSAQRVNHVSQCSGLTTVVWKASHTATVD